jgi:hypothetical protein
VPVSCGDGSCFRHGDGIVVVKTSVTVVSTRIRLGARLGGCPSHHDCPADQRSPWPGLGLARRMSYSAVSFRRSVPSPRWAEAVKASCANTAQGSVHSPGRQPEPQKSGTLSPSPSTWRPRINTSSPSGPASKACATRGLTRTASRGERSTRSSASLTRPDSERTT